jgi:hypothetical protein
MEIPLRAQKEVIGYAKVSPEDFEWASKYKWRVNTNGYICSTIGIIDKETGTKKFKDVKLHIEIMQRLNNNQQSSDGISHVNKDKLDNQRNNLKAMDNGSISQRAVKSKENSTSKFIGVFYRPDAKKYRACCANVSLGSFNNEIDAAKAYDKFALVKYGKNAQTNGLVEYEEIEGLTLDDVSNKKEEKSLPKYITYRLTDYCVAIRNNGTLYRSYHKTLEAAKDKLDEYFELIKQSKEQKIITKNDNGYAYIKTKDGQEVIVDEDTWENVTDYVWTRNKNGSVVSKIGALHRYIMQANKNQDVSHINGNQLDNRKENLIVSKKK